ncbi:MAG: translation elongation factor Ts [Candidatus Omnitrophica bacterium]|nr:translation elongation factor Ts [Candidatus Omnitrophota bacterium]MBU4478880.1 translation elongation factor Ts [Candidatus Omnitrophota bacterium]MCG2702966.1 translation elongation factor Ts [Candidatus Omnitrophota bacterium]
MTVTTEQIKTLREKTNAGFMDCKKALQETGGDIEKAVAELRKKGLAVVAKRAGRTAKEGCVESYIHLGGKIGVLIEVNCETDFVARNEQFKEFVKDLAMQIAAASPQYLSSDEVPQETIEKEKEIFKAQAGDKPAHVLEKMMEGKINKFYQDICLLEQPYVKDDKIKIKDYLNSVIAKIGENIVIRRFTRYQLGEEA